MVDRIVEQPAVVDAKGNITPHGQSGIDIPLSFEDSAGNPRDVSQAVIVFVVKDKLRVALEAGDSDHERRLVLTQEQIDTVGITEGNKGRPFAVIDESGEVPDVVWEGYIIPRVFTKSTV